jgi:hypothetical protein
MKLLLTLCTFCALSWPSMARDLTIELHSPEWLTKAREAIDGKNYDLPSTCSRKPMKSSRPIGTT